MNIKSLSVNERPREKLLNKGKSYLSDAELLAIIIGSGSKEESSISLSHRILSSVNYNWNELAKLSINDLCKFKGIGKVKAIEIITSLEIGKRRSLQEALNKAKILSSRDAFNIFHPIIGDNIMEEFWVLFLNQANEVLKHKKIAKGGITSAIVDIRLIFKHALEVNAVSIIIAHNHPSGNTNPSEADIDVTSNIKEAGDLLNIKLLDHLIISQKSFFSFSDEGIL